LSVPLALCAASAAGETAGSVTACDVGSKPVIAAIPVALATMTATAAPAINGWIRLRGEVLVVTFVFIAVSAGRCLQ
jgi:hypothetical protein